MYLCMECFICIFCQNKQLKSQLSLNKHYFCVFIRKHENSYRNINLQLFFTAFSHKHNRCKFSHRIIVLPQHQFSEMLTHITANNCEAPTYTIFIQFATNKVIFHHLCLCMPCLLLFLKFHQQQQNNGQGLAINQVIERTYLGGFVCVFMCGYVCIFMEAICCVQHIFTLC